MSERAYYVGMQRHERSPSRKLVRHTRKQSYVNRVNSNCYFLLLLKKTTNYPSRDPDFLTNRVFWCTRCAPFHFHKIFNRAQCSLASQPYFPRVSMRVWKVGGGKGRKIRLGQGRGEGGGGGGGGGGGIHTSASQRKGVQQCFCRQEYYFCPFLCVCSSIFYSPMVCPRDGRRTSNIAFGSSSIPWTYHGRVESGATDT